MKLNWPSKLGRKALGLVLAAGMTVGTMAVGYADAISTYCVSVASNSVSVLHNNKVTHSFKAANSNIAIGNDAASGDLLVSFNDSSGGTTTMSFGQQPILLLYGNIGNLDLTSALNKPIVIGAKCTVGNLMVNSPVKVSIWGKVNGGVVNAAANVIAANGSTVSNLESRNSGANFFANAGSTVNGTKYQGTATSGGSNGNTFIYIGNGGSPTVNENSSVLIFGNGSSSGGSSSGSNNNWNVGGSNNNNNNNWNNGGSSQNYITHNYDGGYTITAVDISANYYDQLGNLLSKLGSSVGAADKSGKRVSGTVAWYNNSNSTVVRGGGEFQFLFTPSNSRISPMVGTIRIVTNGTGSPSGPWYDDEDDEWYDRYGEYVDLEIEEIVIREDQLGRRLVRFTNDLKKAVTAYNEDGREIRGTVQWLYNEKVEEPGWYEFVFIPAASKYETVRDEVKIVLEKKEEDSSSSGSSNSCSSGADQNQSTGGSSSGGSSSGGSSSDGGSSSNGSSSGGSSSGGSSNTGTGTIPGTPSIDGSQSSGASISDSSISGSASWSDIHSKPAINGDQGQLNP